MAPCEVIGTHHFDTYENLSEDSLEEECIQMKNQRLGQDVMTARPE